MEERKTGEFWDALPVWLEEETLKKRKLKVGPTQKVIIPLVHKKVGKGLV